MGTAQKIYGLGQGAFQATDGSVVVRKDWKVLVVDTSGLPAEFGVPSASSGTWPSECPTRSSGVGLAMMPVRPEHRTRSR